MFVAAVLSRSEGTATIGREPIEIVSGEVTHHILSPDLFNIDKAFIFVRSSTDINRWLRSYTNKRIKILVSEGRDYTFSRKETGLRGPLVHTSRPEPDSDQVTHQFSVGDVAIAANAFMEIQRLLRLLEDLDRKEVVLIFRPA